VDDEIRKQNELKKAYLQQYRLAKIKCIHIRDEIEQLRDAKMFPSLLLNDMPHSHNITDLSGYAAKIDTEIGKLQRSRLNAINLYTEISNKINCVSNGNEREILRMRYLDIMCWNEIAHKMHYSIRQTTRIHGNALLHFKL